MAMGMRTIYVAVRGLNYTDRATREVGANVDKMMKKQQELRTQMVQTFAAGIMWAAMAGMMVMGIMKIMEASMAGRRVLRGFTHSISQLTKALSDQFAKILGPLISLLSTFMEIMAKNEPIMRLIASAMILGTVFLAIKGVTMLLGVALQYAGTMFASTTVAMNTFTVYAGYGTAQVLTLSGAFTVLQASLGPAFIIFMAMYNLAMAFGNYAPVLLAVIAALTIAMVAYAAASWSAATALSILTFGVAAIIGVGAAIAARASMPSYAIGTKFVQRTGPAIVHEGEEIRSAYEVNAQRRSQIESMRPYSTKRGTQVIISIGTVKTKADEEELKPLILKVVKDAMDNKV